ncbi:hypothetical protein K503DRAFT_865004 [Rhizopogon vinicolor AM-OR11-026]|uniref:RING-type domain-containing protein n=1 Tax=Rhizopogon vinicolor AM-OR11-026 TaxID=1314800 RepID=A0A1B7N525_9AGAM|nr:hypothetical protein K503DRAFT_865004 [Rhizopogon vinicolor AM-OR11-026]
MPATRLSSQKSPRPPTKSPYPSPTRATASRSKLNQSAAAEVIVLSSDDEDARPSTRTRSKRKPSKKSSSGEVLEIFSSSSDEGPTLPRGLAKSCEGLASQRELSRLKRANDRLEQQLADHRLQLDNSTKRLKEQAQELTAQRQELAVKCEEIDVRCQEIELQRQKLAAFQPKGASGLPIDATKLEDTLSCDICANLMYSPYILLNCGHCYCEGCLKGWFDETLTKHIRMHPTYDMNRDPMPRKFPQLLHALHPYISIQLRTQLLATYNNYRQQQPEYTCPGCRTEVTEKPVVNYAIKDVVSVVASALGQSDTRVQSSTSRLVQQTAPFDGFFPR